MNLLKTAPRPIHRWTPFALRIALVALVLFADSPRHAKAQGGCDDDCVGPVVPEIDPSLGAGGLALVGGVVLLVRGRRVR